MKKTCAETFDDYCKNIKHRIITNYNDIEINNDMSQGVLDAMLVSHLMQFNKTQKVCAFKLISAIPIFLGRPVEDYGERKEFSPELHTWANGVLKSLNKNKKKEIENE